jgi:hypothetical protein
MATSARVPDLGPSPARRLAAPLGVLASVGAAALALRLRDPHQQGSWGLCPFKEITGWNCPLCGGLRAVNDLGHGQVAEAAHSNLLFVGIFLPLAVAAWIFWLQGSWGRRRTSVPPALVRALTVALAVVAVAFTVYRNTPWGSAWRAA